ncbi:MAG: hypothetical protein MK085_00885 [Phycisphaerales bacterium]|nr:hypothetical protein [Phycisphaerales bacterium]
MHEANRIDELLLRIKNLEGSLKESASRRRRERRMLGGGVALACISFLGGLGAVSSGDDVLRTKRLEIIDDDNNMILVAGASMHGGRIDLMDSTGQKSAGLGSNRKGGSFTLWNRQGEQVVTAFASTMGGRAEFNGPTGNPATVISANTRGGMIEIRDDTDQPVVEARCGMEGGEIATRQLGGGEVSTMSAGIDGGVISLRNLTAKSELTFNGSDLSIEARRRNDLLLQVAGKPEGGLVVLGNSEGETRLTLNGNDSGGLVVMHNARNVPVVALGASGASAGLRVRNEQGKVVAALGDDDKDTGVLELSGPTGRTGALFSVENKGGYLALVDDRGYLLMEAGPQEHGGLLRIHDANNQVAAELLGIDGGGGRIGAGNNDGQRRGVLEAPLGGPVILTLFSDRTQSLSLGALAEGGLLNIRKATGEIALTAGVGPETPGGLLSIRNRDGGEAVRIGSSGDGAGEIDAFNAEGSRKRTLSGP